jgi:hypothetical protein
MEIQGNEVKTGEAAVQQPSAEVAAATELVHRVFLSASGSKFSRLKDVYCPVSFMGRLDSLAIDCFHTTYLYVIIRQKVGKMRGSNK